MSAISSPRIGGFVVFGNSRGTIDTCLESLCAVCDEVVAVDSDSDDGSAERVAARGVRRVNHTWRGFGAARAVAARELGDCDYVFFLDSDERLADGALEHFARWRQSQPTLPHYTLRRDDWAEVGGHRFVFRSETRTRLIRRDCASWTDSMIVHEALPRRASAPLGAVIDHAFYRDGDSLRQKQRYYSLLWAVMAHQRGRRSPLLAFGRQPLHWVRNALIKGALWRGGIAGSRLSWLVGEQHALKYRYLDAIRAGAYSECVSAYARGDFGTVIELVRAALAES